MLDCSVFSVSVQGDDDEESKDDEEDAAGDVSFQLIRTFDIPQIYILLNQLT